MNLTYRDIQEILRLLDDSPYDEMKLQTDEFHLALKRGGDGGWTQETRTRAGEESRIEGLGDGMEQAPRNAAAAPDQQQAPEIAATETGLMEIRAPMVGTFYRAPKPGAEPFVDIGSRVEENSVIAIIEVMKLMSSIPAGLKGEVAEILADDASYVEKGQLLMRVRPEQA